jgi:putative FmdB family regulatory protein
MPEYNYYCKACQYSWEEFRTMAEFKKPCDEPCPECKAVGEVNKGVNSFSGVKIDTNHDWTKAKNLPNDFRERMNQIADGQPEQIKSRLNDQYK